MLGVSTRNKCVVLPLYYESVPDTLMTNEITIWGVSRARLVQASRACVSYVDGTKTFICRIEHCNSRVAKTDERNVLGANEDTCLNPRPPELMGRQACNHCGSVKEMLKTFETPSLRILSIADSPQFPVQGDVLSKTSAS